MFMKILSLVTDVMYDLCAALGALFFSLMVISIIVLLCLLALILLPAVLIYGTILLLWDKYAESDSPDDN